MIWLLAHPLPPPSVFPCVVGRVHEFTDGIGKGEGGGARGAKSYDRKKAWSFINHSILSAYLYPALFAHSLPIAVLAGLLDNSCNFKE